MSVCGHARGSVDITVGIPHKQDVFPAHWVARIFGFHRNHKWNTRSKKLNRKQLAKVLLDCLLLFSRRFTFLFYLTVCLLWVILFSICVFSYELLQFEKGKIKGTERESNIIIRLLDNIPWTAIMGRNIIILVIFYYRYPQLVELTNSLSRLLRTLDPSSRPLKALIRSTWKSLYISWTIIVVNFLMLLMYYFNANFSDIFSNWNFQPFPLKLVGWQTTICLLFMSLPPFLMAQVVLGSVVGLAAGGMHLVRLLNQNLEQLCHGQEAKGHQDNGPTLTKGHQGNGPTLTKGHQANGPTLAKGHHANRESYSPLGLSMGSTTSHEQEMKTAQFEKIAALRRAHLRILQYVDAVTEAFSEVLLVAMAGDFAAAIGFVGLLIGRPPSSNIVSFYFARIYHGLATVTWMGFYLCAQYWPLIILPEESERTYHHVQALSFKSGSSQAEKWERELLHFLLATKETHVAIVAGRLLFFSRHLSLTMITLLCSYGVLVYELLHRDRSGASESHSFSNPHLANSASVNDSSLLAMPASSNIVETLRLYQNMSMGAHDY